MNSGVCNAGPLIALTGIGQAGLLHELFGEVLVSGKVRDEVEAGGKTGAGASLFANAPWIRVIRLTNLPDPLLETLLDQGEAETIALALQSSATLILMDERKGRKIARDIYGLAVIGIGRLMTEAKKAGPHPLSWIKCEPKDIGYRTRSWRRSCDRRESKARSGQ